ncbi:hypothetical protein [Gordonia sp. MP11Mi]|uniref:Uncharacterized protein n=1 Tax=Gordonia sp. MP11Mi TaxID=3022769 RepID=A0AA97D040_9ACTN
MSRKSAGKPSRISGRTVMIVVAVAAIFFVGAATGGGWTKDRSLQHQRDTVARCVPIVDVAQLDACLAGTLQ